MHDTNTVSVRYMVDDVQAAVDFYTTMFGFEELMNAAPAFASVQDGNLRLLLAGPTSSAGRPGCTSPCSSCSRVPARWPRSRTCPRWRG